MSEQEKRTFVMQPLTNNALDEHKWAILLHPDNFGPNPQITEAQFRLNGLDVNFDIDGGDRLYAPFSMWRQYERVPEWMIPGSEAEQTIDNHSELMVWKYADRVKHMQLLQLGDRSFEEAYNASYIAIVQAWEEAMSSSSKIRWSMLINRLEMAGAQPQKGDVLYVREEQYVRFKNVPQWVKPGGFYGLPLVEGHAYRERKEALMMAERALIMEGFKKRYVPTTEEICDIVDKVGGSIIEGNALLFESPEQFHEARHLVHALQQEKINAQLSTNTEG